MRNQHRARNLTLWAAALALLSPLGFNCHSRTDQSPAVPATSGAQYQPDSEDQTVRELVTEDGAPKSDSKVRISTSATISAAKASQLGLASKLASTGDALVAKDTSLLALYDNDCRKKHGSPLRFEAEAYRPQTDVSLAALSAEAEKDACLVRIDENRFQQWAKPVADSPSATSSGNASALATANDPRLSEAKQVAFSKALSAWDWFFSGSGIKNDVVVAVVDSGIAYSHPDLAENIYTSSTGKHGFDFANADEDPMDDYGHGTHVAGIIGARANNAMGITGIMGTRVKLMGVKVLDNQGSGDEAGIVNGIRYAADQGVQVINLSLGGSFASPSIRDAMIYAASKGIVLVVAAGNDGVQMDATTNFFTPSCYAKDIPGVIAVGSVDAVTGARSSFSNTSTNYVWIAGPGSGGILSTYTGNTYSVLQGTSMASPAVAGAAALLVGAFKANSIAYAPVDVINILTESARPVAALTTLFRNGATLDVERAAKLFYSRYVMAGNGATEAQ
jgi:subtilisin family serine protease